MPVRLALGLDQFGVFLIREGHIDILHDID